MFEKDILVPITDELHNKYIELLKQRLPLTLRPYLFLLLQHKWKKCQKIKEIDVRCMYTVYVPQESLLDNCTLIALSTDKNHLNQLVSGDELNKCFRFTNRIKWDHGPLIESIDIKHFNAYLSAINEKQLRLNDEETTPSYCLYLPKENITNDIIIPSAYYIASLTENHSQLINSTWHYKDDKTLDYIKSLIYLNGGHGLFDRQTNQLLSWILINENMSAGCLFTIESMRRRGLGELLLRYHCKYFVKHENLDVLAYADKDNDASIKLLKRIGFKILNECFWYRTIPKTNG